MSTTYMPMNIPQNTTLNFDQSVVKNVYIRKIALRETGTYNEQYARNYEAHLSPGSVNALAQKAEESGTNVFKPSMISGLASNMISISAAPDGSNPIHIENGWGSRRLLFFMDVLTEDISGGQNVYFIQGYTNYTGLSLQNKHLDPDMVFYINNIVSSRLLVPRSTPNGVIRPHSLVSTNHLLYDAQSYSHPDQWMMRPEDIYKVLTRNQLGASTGGQARIYDNRSKLGHMPNMSRRTNAIASNYASTLVGGFVQAANQVDPVANPTDAYDSAVNFVGETMVTLNPFLNALARKRTSGMVSGVFQWRDLLKLDPNLANPSNNIVTVTVNGPTQLRGQHTAGQTTDWSGASIETKYAATISQAVPALMLECMLYQASFSTNNMMSLQENQFSGIYTIITNAQGITGEPVIQQAEAFKQRLEIEVLRDISYNNQQKFDIRVQASVFGDTWLSISVDGGPIYDFVTPTFCDGLIAPVLTQDYARIENIASSVDTLVTHVADAIGSSGYERRMFSMPGNGDNYSHL